MVEWWFAQSTKTTMRSACVSQVRDCRITYSMSCQTIVSNAPKALRTRLLRRYSAIETPTSVSRRRRRDVRYRSSAPRRVLRRGAPPLRPIRARALRQWRRAGCALWGVARSAPTQAQRAEAAHRPRVLPPGSPPFDRSSRPNRSKAVVSPSSTVSRTPDPLCLISRQTTRISLGGAACCCGVWLLGESFFARRSDCAKRACCGV